MTADIVVRANALLPVPDQDDALARDVEKAVIARLFELRCMRREYPVIAEYALTVALEYRGVGIECAVE